MQITTEQLFTDAHTQYGYFPDPVSDDTLRALYDLLKWAPIRQAAALVMFESGSLHRERGFGPSPATLCGV